VDLATLIGLVGGIGIILGAILMGSDVGTFMNVPSVMVVLGGTLAVTMMRFSMSAFFGSFKVLVKVFRSRLDTPEALIERAVELAGVARREGLLALEKEEVEDPFFEKGIRLCVDGLEPEFVHRVLTQEMDQTVERHENGRRIFRSIGEAAPSMGMVGTLIGLVQMLSHMDDPKTIGPAMAVALLTTLYGCMIANLFALPIADKLDHRSQEEALTKAIVIESVASIQEGRNPRVMEQLLRSYLPGSQADGGLDDMDMAGAEYGG